MRRSGSKGSGCAAGTAPPTPTRPRPSVRPDRPPLHRPGPEHEIRRDITYLPIDGGKFCCLATITDLASRCLVGRAVADHMRADFVTPVQVGTPQR
jgi:transposase InsO family protein